jgi:hypothetical protein
MKIDDIPREHLEAALAQLEVAKAQRQQDRPPGPVIRLVAEAGESAEAAEACYRAENPDTPKNARWIIPTIVAPPSPHHDCQSDRDDSDDAGTEGAGSS